MLKYNLTIMKLAGWTCIICGLISLIPTFNSAFGRLLLEFNLICMLSWLLRFLIPTYFSHFYLLYKRRNYEFHRFHASREIPLALIISLCMTIYIVNKLYSSIILVLSVTQWFVYQSCLSAMKEDYCKSYSIQGPFGN